MQKEMLQPRPEVLFGSRIGNIRWWRYVVVEAPVFVVGDQKQGSVEERLVGSERFVDRRNQRLGAREVRADAVAEPRVGSLGDEVVLRMLVVARAGRT